MPRLRYNPPRPFREAIEHSELELRGTRARAFQFQGGSRDPGRAMVCIAGMGADGRSFARQKDLSRDHFVLSLNLPTDTPASEDPLRFAVEAIEEYVEREPLHRPVLLGSSFGGAVAALAALRAPERFAGLILVGAVLARWQIPLAFPGFIDLLEAPAPLAALFAPAAAAVMGGFALDKDARDELVREARHFSGAELKRRLQSLLALDLRPKLRELRIPTLFVHGRRDLLVPWRRARKVASMVPGARFELIHGAGHLPYLSHPEQFNALVSSFLSGPSPSRGAHSGAPRSRPR